MLPSSAFDRRVYLHALADPAVLVREEDTIARLFCGALKISRSPQQRIALAPGSGWFDYSALDELWDRRGPPALPDAAAAMKAAEGALNLVQSACSDANKAWPAGLRGLALLPPVANLRRVALNVVPRPDGSGLDHWLYRAEPQLALDGGGRTRAGVFGTLVEVRVGHMGRVIAVRSRWRPLSGERKLVDLTPYRAPTSDDDDGSGGPMAAPTIRYLLDGDGLPQFYLAPYYFTTSDDDLDITSASPFSLKVEVGRIAQTTSGLSLVAVARGGSGRYLYNWGYYLLTRPEEGIVTVGAGAALRLDTEEGSVDASQIELGNFACVVLVNVRDAQTGAFKHHQHQVFSSPAQPDAPGDAAVEVT